MENQPNEKPFFLNRRQAAVFIEATYGARITVGTLAKMAVAGTGPAFRRFGRASVYEIDDLNTWAKARLSARVHSTSGLNPRDPFRKRPGRPRKPFGEAPSIGESA